MAAADFVGQRNAGRDQYQDNVVEDHYDHIHTVLDGKHKDYF